MSSLPRVLFVCTKFGGRSVLATYLCNRKSRWGKIAVASSFDPGHLPRGYFKLMHSLGYEIPEEYPLSLFEHYKQDVIFDYVVMMCCEQSGEHCHIFSVSVKELYGKNAKIVTWSVPDLSQINGSQEEVSREFSRIIGRLDVRIDHFLRELEKDHYNLITRQEHR